MISSHRPITSKLSRFFASPSGLALTAFALIWLMGASLGLTDDEAYYWVLSRRPDWGYAFHPPMVAWLIALSEKIGGPLLGTHSAAVVRFPAAASMGAMLWLAASWMRRVNAASEQASVWTLIALPGLFALSWMVVPDTSLFLGWTLAFTASWSLCFDERVPSARFFALAAGCALLILSKYSGVLAIASAGLVILCWAPRPRRAGALLAVVGGFLVGVIPVLIWNARHEWASILYQVRERQGGGVSFARYLRFWLIELVAGGPFLLLSLPRLFARERRARFVLIWAAPALAVFFVQPLWADFKPHWAFIALWPVLLLLAATGGRWGRLQRAYGFAMIALVWLACQYPILGKLSAWTGSGTGSGKPDPRWDVTNDLYGWRELPAFLEAHLGPRWRDVPVVGSWYQTAAQGAFAAGEGARFTMLPRDLKARDEWPELGVSDGFGPAWPRLRARVIYVADNRYQDGPGFVGARCESIGAFEAFRAGLLAKRIMVWICDP